MGTPRTGTMGFTVFQLGDRFIYVITREVDPLPPTKAIIESNR